MNVVGEIKTRPNFVYQPEKYWDRLFAPAGHVGMITTVDEQGRVNGGSFATVIRIVHKPVQIAFTGSPTGHTIRNVRATGQCVINLPSFERRILEQVRILGLPFAEGVNELEKAGLTAIPSKTVKPPRIEECPRHFECEVVWTKDWINRTMVVANVLACSVRDDCVTEKGYIKWDVIKPTLFCGAPYVNTFVEAVETMSVDMTWDGPEAGAADDSIRRMFEDM